MNSTRSKYYRNRNEELQRRRDTNWRDLNIIEYGKKSYLDVSKGVECVKQMIGDNQPFLIGRLGETEARTVYSFQYLWYKPRTVRGCAHDLCNNAGFFPNKTLAIKRFCRLYVDSIRETDYLGMCLWAPEELFVDNYAESMKGCFSSGVLDILLLDDPWTSALEGKRVLVISPFSESIMHQYERRELIFPDKPEYLPRFDLNVLKAIQSVGGKGAIGYKDWFDAFEYMKRQIEEIEFDIALLGCGAYGMPLAAFIKSIGKQAIYMGGCLQLMFGIIGKRWENREYVKKYVNEYWVRPSESERPSELQNVEGGCYW